MPFSEPLHSHTGKERKESIQRFPSEVDTMFIGLYWGPMELMGGGAALKMLQVFLGKTVQQQQKEGGREGRARVP